MDKSIAVVTALFLALCYIIVRETPEVITVSLQGEWSTIMSWDITDYSRSPNPSSNVAGELLIGDATRQYQMPNIKTYFRFKLPDSLSKIVIFNAVLRMHCSFGGDDRPRLQIYYVDLPQIPPLEQSPQEFPLGHMYIEWDDVAADWRWETGGVYDTPDISILLGEYLHKYGSREFMVVVKNVGPTDNFKGISIAPPPELIITYKYRPKFFLPINTK